MYVKNGTVTAEEGSSLIFRDNVAYFAPQSLGDGAAIFNCANGVIHLKGTAEFIDNQALHAGGAIYNQGTIDISVDTTFSGNFDSVSEMSGTARTGGNPNDIHNLGTINIEGGKTRLDGGISGTGTVNVLNDGILTMGIIDTGNVSGLPTLALAKQFEVTGTLNVGAVPAPAARISARAFVPSANFAPNSMLVVDGSSREVPLVSNGGSVTVEDGAKLHINNARVGVTQITDGFNTATLKGSGWNDDNLTVTTSNVLAVVEGASVVDGEAGTQDVVVTISVEEAAEVLPELGPTDNVDDMMEEGLNDTEEEAPAGIRFLSRTLENGIADPGALINEVSRAAVTAGVQNTALRISDTASRTVLDHLSYSNHDMTCTVHSDGTDFWATPMYSNLYTSGMTSDGSSVRGQFGGLALGMDTEAGQFGGGKFRAGVALNGGGQSETKGTVTSTQNDYGFGGLHLYAGWHKDALNIFGSVGYGFGDHEVDMGLPAEIAMGTAKADIDTSAFTADLQAEYQLATAWMDLIPHVGVRYTALHIDAYDLKVGGEVLNSVKSDTQNIVQFPIGVTLSRNFEAYDWNVKPMADVSFIPVSGEKDAHTRVNFSGLNAWDSMNTRIMDSTSWAGTVGIQAEQGKLSIALNYGVQASSHETDQNIQFKLGWKF